MRGSMLIVLALLTLSVPFGEAAPSEIPGAVEPVKGQGCYTFGDDETPAKAKKSALALAWTSGLLSDNLPPTRVALKGFGEDEAYAVSPERIEKLRRADDAGAERGRLRTAAPGGFLK